MASHPINTVRVNGIYSPSLVGFFICGARALLTEDARYVTHVPYAQRQQTMTDGDRACRKTAKR